MMPFPARSAQVRLATFALGCLTLAATTGHAATYEVGPGQPRTHLRDVPWANLQPGDFVNIHPTPGGYHERFQISASGTAAAGAASAAAAAATASCAQPLCELACKLVSRACCSSSPLACT